MAVLLWLVPVSGAHAQSIDPKIAERLTPRQQKIYLEYLIARATFDSVLDKYWLLVEAKRAERRRKRSAGQAFAAGDYVREQPPQFTGPSLPPDITKIIEASREKKPETRSELPGLNHYLASARQHYAFVPERTTEREFKRRYAAEALRFGLTKDQVVRIYALETGGRGTYDMQAGIHPITKQGTPISSALGYAQLLAANSISELVKHGPEFIARLRQLAAKRGQSAERVKLLQRKVRSVVLMLRVARSVRNNWSVHQSLAKTPKGAGIHAINLDADLGPWLQAIKLHGLLKIAIAAGKPRLSGAEIELMNLAGPRTGLEMMEAVGSRMPTSNFFSRRGYYRNTIVRWKSARELLVALDDRMNVNIKHPGSVELASIFDELLARRR